MDTEAITKGWTLPTTKQMSSNTDRTNFNPVLGGFYGNRYLNYETIRGSLWGNEIQSNAKRYSLYYDGNSLYSGYYARFYGLYIRCVSEEKTVLDLTYMRGMKPKIP